MANDKRFIVKNGLRSQNVEFTDSQDGSNQITLNMLNTDTLNFEGDAGSLFSISDDLTGTVFSVGDISGIPIIEVNGDTHNVTFNEFDGKVMIGGTDSGSSDDDVLNVTGNVRATAYYGDGSNLTGIAASGGGVDSAAVSSIITADVDKAFVDALNVDADTFDTLNSTQFLRSDAADTMSANLTIAAGALGTTAGDTVELLDIQSTNSNTSKLRIFTERDASGSDWTTAYTRIQQIIDVTEMSYIQFNGDGKDYGMEFGTNGDELYQKNVRNGQVELYYNNSKKFETSNTGATVTGTLTATTFSGSGASLTSLPAGQLTGTVSDARLPSSISSDITGNAATATTLATARNIDITGVTASAQSFDGSGDISIPVTAVPASLLTGTISDARLPASISSDITGNAATATALATGRNIDVTGVTATAASFDGTGDIAIEVTAVPSSLLTGTISDARLPASISSDITGNAATATTATNVTATANNSTNETVYITFVDGATGGQGIETDTALSYNPSSNTLTAGVFSGSGASLTNLPSGQLSGALPAIDGSSLTSVDAETLDGVNSTSFLRSDASDNYTSGTLTFNSGTQLKLTSNSSIPVLDIDGGGPNFIRFTDNGSTTDAVNIVYRTTPNDLRIERSTNDNIIAEFGGDDGHAALFFNNSQKLTTVTGGVTISGTVTATAFSGDGSALTGIDAGSSVSVSLTAPGSPSEGDMWYDPEYGNLLVYYTDSDTSQWVTTNAPGVPDNSINSSKFSNAVSLIIYDSSGSAVKTLFSPDN